MSEEKKQDFEFQELTDYRKLVTEGMSYSIQRIDILIIALCTSGIFLNITELSKNHENLVYIKWSTAIYVGAIFLNIVSQFFAYYSNRALVVIFNEKVLDYKNDPKNFDEDKYSERERDAHGLGGYVQGFNISSFVFLMAGMVVCLVFYCLS